MASATSWATITVANNALSLQDLQTELAYANARFQQALEFEKNLQVNFHNLLAQRPDPSLVATATQSINDQRTVIAGCMKEISTLGHLIRAHNQQQHHQPQLQQQQQVPNTPLPHQSPHQGYPQTVAAQQPPTILSPSAQTNQQHQQQQSPQPQLNSRNLQHLEVQSSEPVTTLPQQLELERAEKKQRQAKLRRDELRAKLKELQGQGLPDFNPQMVSLTDQLTYAQLDWIVASLEFEKLAETLGAVNKSQFDSIPTPKSELKRIKLIVWREKAACELCITIAKAEIRGLKSKKVPADAPEMVSALERLHAMQSELKECDKEIAAFVLATKAFRKQQQDEVQTGSKSTPAPTPTPTKQQPILTSLQKLQKQLNVQPDPALSEEESVLQVVQALYAKVKQSQARRHLLLFPNQAQKTEPVTTSTAVPTSTPAPTAPSTPTPTPPSSSPTPRLTGRSAQTNEQDLQQLPLSHQAIDLLQEQLKSAQVEHSVAHFCVKQLQARLKRLRFRMSELDPQVVSLSRQLQRAEESLKTACVNVTQLGQTLKRAKAAPVLTTAPPPQAPELDASPTSTQMPDTMQEQTQRQEPE